MAETSIEWTDVTDNVIVVDGGGWWCRRISEGCDHCYAEAINQNSFFGGNGLPYRGAPPANLMLRQDIINAWATQRKPKKHFVASMTDVFGEWVPQWMIFRFLDGMTAAPRQTFQLLTKRADVMAREIKAWLEARGYDRLPSNIWPGVTVENQEMADRRIPELLKIPAAVRFLSVEPLLGPVDLDFWLSSYWDAEIMNPINGDSGSWCEVESPSERGIRWCIVGGESGPNARPMNTDHLISLRDQCVAAGVPIFIKQMGNQLAKKFGCRDLKGGDISEWPAEYRIRQFPEAAITQ